MDHDVASFPGAKEGVRGGYTKFVSELKFGQK